MAKRHKRTKKEQDELDYKQIRAYKALNDIIAHRVYLFCSLTIIGIGVFLALVDGESTGLSTGRYGGVGYVTINGQNTVIIGIIMLVFYFGVKLAGKGTKSE
jgi:hypothetical protein